MKIYSYKYHDLFHPLEKGIFGLTEHYIYNSLNDKDELVPLWGGNASHDEEEIFLGVNAKNKFGEDVKIFEGDCIIISLDGSAGSMTYKPKKKNNKIFKFCLNHHAGIIRIKNNDKINPNYFKYKFENIFKNMAVSDGSKTITKEMIENFIFEIPDLKDQNKYLLEMKKIEQLSKDLNSKIERLENLKSKKVELDNFRNHSLINLNKVLDYCSRNDALSEEGIYNNLPRDNKNTINVLSGSIDDIFYGKIDGDIQNIHHVKKKYVLHVITRGKAGKISFLEKGNYATNTNAFIFYLKDNVIKDLDLDTEDKIKVYLKFLKIYLQNIFFEACSKSDVSVFPLTELMKGLLIPKIKFSEDIKKITDIYDNLENLLTECKDKLDKINLIYKKDFI